MDKIEQRHKARTFNTPLEAGLRVVSILGAAYPRTFDLQRLIAFDYLLVHTGDIGGPESLHPPSPLHSAEMLVRRELIEQALLLMITRELVERQVDESGLRYAAGDNAAPFLASLESDYLRALKQRAGWLIAALADYTDDQFQRTMRSFFDRWVEEFQAAEQSLGTAP